MEKKIGFIGCGNMGTAMIQGILESGKCPPQEMSYEENAGRKESTVRSADQYGQPGCGSICRHFVCGSKATVLCRSVRGNQGSSYRRADSGIHRAGKDTGMV